MNPTFIEKFQVPKEAINLDYVFYTKAEEELVIRMEQKVFTKEDIQKTLNLSRKEAEELAESSYRRGILAVEDEEKGLYRLGNFYGRLDILAVAEQQTYRSIPEEERKKLDDWYFAAYLEGLGDDPVPTADRVATLDETLEFMDSLNQDVFYLCDCDCRALTGDCGKPTRTCIGYKAGVNSNAHRGISEKITLKQAKEIVKNADKVGLMHTIGGHGICNCCGDCCYLFRAQRQRDSVGIWPPSVWTAKENPAKCIGCGACIRRCQLGAISWTEQKKDIKIDPKKCVGCGICVTGCRFDAIKLQGR